MREMAANLTARAELSAAQREELERQLAPLELLEAVIRWGLSQSPECNIVEVVVQDEFCHDVVMEWRDGLFLAFDTT